MVLLPLLLFVVRCHEPVYATLALRERAMVRLEVDQRRAVDAVDPADPYDIAGNSDDFHGRHADRIWPDWRAEREGAAAGGIVFWRLQHEIAARLVQPIDRLR